MAGKKLNNFNESEVVQKTAKRRFFRLILKYLLGYLLNR